MPVILPASWQDSGLSIGTPDLAGELREGA